MDFRLMIAIAWVAAVVLSSAWLVVARTGTRSRSGLLDAVLDWLAASTLLVLIGGGLLMFGVVLLVFFVGDTAASVGLWLAWVLIAASPILVAIVQYRGRRQRTR